MGEDNGFQNSSKSNCPKGLLCRGPSKLMMCVCLCVCVSVCVSRLDRKWTGFETGYAVSRVVKHAKNTVFTTFLKKKDIFFAIFFKSFFLQSFLQSFLVSDSSSSRSSENLTKTCNLELYLHVYYSRNPRNLFGVQMMQMMSQMMHHLCKSSCLFEQFTLFSFEFPHKRPFGPPCFAGVFQFDSISAVSSGLMKRRSQISCNKNISQPKQQQFPRKP